MMLVMGIAVLPAWAGKVDSAPKQSAWIAVVVAIGLVVLISVASFLSSKRGHQD